LLVVRSLVAPMPSLAMNMISLSAASAMVASLQPCEPQRLSGVVLGLPFARGAFGSILSAHGPDGQCCIAKRAGNQPNAKKFLAAEAIINRKLQAAAPGSAHLAPFAGTTSIAGIEHLVWHACPGVKHSLDWYLKPSGSGPLAQALGVTEERLPAKLLRELLSAIALVHSCGVVHRDVKPENWLVDTHTHSLRLIDLGAACDAKELIEHGLGQQQQLTTTRAFAPPELRLSEGSLWTFDVYSAAMVWLRILASTEPAPQNNILPDLPAASVTTSASHATSSASALSSRQGFEAICSELQSWDGHGLDQWLAYSRECVGSCSQLGPWHLLGRMLSPDPEDRITASEALCSLMADTGAHAEWLLRPLW